MRKTPDATLRERAAALGLHGLLARWHAIEGELWLAPLIESEETERFRRSLERRIAHAALGAFKPVADFDWTHPRKIDRDAVEALFDLDFLREHINVVFIGSGGVGKTMRLAFGTRALAVWRLAASGFINPPLTGGRGYRTLGCDFNPHGARPCALLSQKV